MVKGLNTFREFFKDYSNNYILIGGAACDEHLSELGLNFRVTKDLDIIIIVEALNLDFVIKFWKFISIGKYEFQEMSSGEKKYFRFIKPAVEDFPYQIELFSRNPDLFDLADNSRFTPIPVEDDLSSFSAILLDDEYYNFTITHGLKNEDLNLASIESLICLKARAYLDLKVRKETGEAIDNNKIKKHKNDIFRLATILTADKKIKLPDGIHKDLFNALNEIEKDIPDLKSIGKGLGTGQLNGKVLLEQIREVLSLT